MSKIRADASTEGLTESLRLGRNFITGNLVDNYKVGLDTLSHEFVYAVTTDSVEASSTTTVINATAHLARPGDIVEFFSGALANQIAIVDSTTTNAITLSQNLTVAPSTGNVFFILRYKNPRVDSSGNLLASVTGTVSISTSTPGYVFGKQDSGAIQGSYGIELLLAVSNFRIVTVFNSLNQAINLSWDASNDHYELDPFEGFTWDYATNWLEEANTLWVRYNSTPPTSGSVRATGAYV